MPLSVLVRTQIDTFTPEVTMENPHKTQNESTTQPNTTTPQHMSSIVRLNIILHRHLLRNVHCCPVHNSQEGETLSACVGNDNSIAVYKLTATLLSCKGKMVGLEKVILGEVTQSPKGKAA